MERHHHPVRTCVGCRRRQDKGLLVRFVADAGGSVQVDVRGCEPGRGAYTCPVRACVEKAARHGRFARTLRREVRADAPELWGRVVGAGIGEKEERG